MADNESTSSPSFTPRLPDVDVDAYQRLLDELDDELSRFEGSTAYQYSAAYTYRAHVRFVLGHPMETVLDEFWMSARTLGADPTVHLSRHAPEQLLTRRILPVELGVLGGDIELGQRLANAYGFPLAAARADMGGPELRKEALIISPALVGEPIMEAQHLVGFAAAAYSNALSAAIRGYEDEVLLAMKLLSNLAFRGELSDGLKAAMVRYTGLCSILLEMVQPGGRDLPAMLADQIQRYTTALANRLGEQYARPTRPDRFVDTSSLALIAIAVLSNQDLSSFPPDPELTPAAVGYRDAVDIMSAPRELPDVPGELSADALVAAAHAMMGMANQKTALEREIKRRQELAAEAGDAEAPADDGDGNG